MGVMPLDAGGCGHSTSDGASAQECGEVYPPSVRAVVFDFDATLTACEELQVHRLFPERGFGGKEIDVAWLREKGFGGEARLAGLGRLLQALRARGAELHIASFADRAVIMRALAILGALPLFFSEHIVGWEELHGPFQSKGAYIRDLMFRRSWSFHEVLFVDDQARNLEDAAGVCLTYRTRGCGLTVEEMDALSRKAAGGIFADLPFPAASVSTAFPFASTSASSVSSAHCGTHMMPAPPRIPCQAATAAPAAAAAAAAASAAAPGPAAGVLSAAAAHGHAEVAMEEEEEGGEGATDKADGAEEEAEAQQGRPEAAPQRPPRKRRRRVDHLGGASCDTGLSLRRALPKPRTLARCPKSPANSRRHSPLTIPPAKRDQ